MNTQPKVWTIFRPPPPKPDKYPHEIIIADLYGHQRHTWGNDLQYHACVFWYWDAMPCGSSVAQHGDADML